MHAGRSVVAYRTLPLMWPDRCPTGWDDWGRPWALMDIAEGDISRKQKAWSHPHTEGRALITVLVRYDEEPYYFPNATAILRALHPLGVRGAEEVKVTPPGSHGQSTQTMKKVEQLLRPDTYPHCAAVSSCLQRWPKFAHQGEGYCEGRPMPG